MNRGQTRLYDTLMGNPSTGYNGAIGRTSSRKSSSGSSDDGVLGFFKKRARSAENAVGTTGASVVSAIDSANENMNAEYRQKEYKNSLNKIAKKYGFDDWDAVWDARDAAEAAGDTAKVKEMDEGVVKELQAQTAANSADATKAAKNWEKYRKDSYVGKKINQDRGKFLGSAMNTESTLFDVLSMAAGIPNTAAINGAQGAWEGLADELERGGFEDFDAKNAALNMASGAAGGAVVGGLNTKLNNRALANNGKLFGGSNILSRGANIIGNSGVGRGALSGAVGGAVGAGLTSAMTGEDINTGFQNALQGAKSGAIQGAVAGGIMSGVNRIGGAALNKFAPETAEKMQQNAQAWDNWKKSGNDFNERLTNTLNSGDSAVGNWLNKKTQSNLLASAGNIGNKVQNVGVVTATDPWDRIAQQNGYETYDDVIESYIKANPGVELNPKGAAGQILTWLDENPNTPTTAAGWAKKAGQRVLEDVNNSNLGNRIQVVDQEPNSTISNSRARAEADNLYSLTKNNDIPWGEFMNRFRNMSTEAKDFMLNHATEYGLDYGTQKTLLADGYKPGVSVNRWEAQTDLARQKLAQARRHAQSAHKANDRFERIEVADYEALDNLGLDPEKFSRYSNRADLWDSAVSVLENDLASDHSFKLGNNDNMSTPTTAKGWLKRAGKRAVEDINNSNLGLRVQKVNDLPEDIRNMRISDNMAEIPEAEVVAPKRNLTTIDALEDQAPTAVMRRQPENEVIDLTKSFDNQGLSPITNRNKLQALGTQLQNAAETQKYSGIYDALDAKTAQRAADTNAPQRLADLGVKSQDYNEYAKTSTYVNKVISDLADKSGVKVNALDLPEQLSAGSLSLPFNSESNLKTYNSAIRNIVADGSSPTEYSASQLLEASRRFGKNAANIKGNTEAARELRNAYTEAKYKLRDIATDALERSGVTGEATNSRIAQGLKDLGANQAVQEYYTEPVNGKAPTASDYIRRSSLFEQARDMGNQIEAEKYTRSASKASTNPITRLWAASGLDKPLETVLKNTVAPAAAKVTDLAGKTIEKAGDVGARVSGSGVAEGASNLGRGLSNAIDTAGTTIPPSQALWNQIGRTEANSQAEQARTANYLVDATKKVQQPQTLEEMAMATPTSSTTLTGSMYDTGTAPIAQATTQQTTSNNSYFPTTGDYWTDILGVALTSAINANDVGAFTSLYGMYQDALVTAQKQANSSSSNAQIKLTDTQRRAYAAENSLNELEALQPDFAYTLSDIPIVGNIATLGGNTYDAAANSLATQIGYMLSGANIKEEEAQRIGQSYVPQPFDNEAVRKQKLQRARQIIEQYKNTYGDSDLGYSI